jgi:hypothetical protein
MAEPVQEVDPWADLDLSDAPSEFLCPITQDVMRDPWIFPDGYTYEKKAAIQWITGHRNSPVTREPMRVTDGVFNSRGKAWIDVYITKKRKEKMQGEIGPAAILDDIKTWEVVVESFVVEVRKVEERSGIVILDLWDGAGMEKGVFVGEMVDKTVREGSIVKVTDFVVDAVGRFSVKSGEIFY